MKAQFSYVQWGRVLQTGILIAILDFILNLALVFLTFHIWGQPDQYQIVRQVTFWRIFIVDILLTVGGGVWVARKVKRAAPLHGFLVGLVAALIFFLLGPAFDLVTLVSFVLTVAAGWLGGVLGSRVRRRL